MRIAEDIRRPALFFSSRARRFVCVGLVALSLQLGLGGCFGRFALTRAVYGMNQSVNDKWLRSILTFVLIAAPVYGVAAFADWTVFNTVEFWSGKNPIDGQSSDRPPPPVAPPALTRSMGDTKFEFSEDGRVLRVESPARVLTLEMDGDNAVLRNREGDLNSSMRTDPDGNAEVFTANGELLDRKSTAQQARLGAALEVSGEALLSELEFQGTTRIARR